ncbi:radical SAM protein, partial [Candidatus Woesearchaeota archaeon]|nr:radical SAM protein [Candidatus Woesearchaeota archaeon]
MVVKRESAKRYGMWSKLSTENSDIMFNSSHSYPLSSEEYIENVKRIVDNETPKIMYAEIRPSNYCNHGCDGCFSAELRKKNKTQLSKEALNKVIQDLSDLDTRAIRFSGGGEPLTHPNIEEAIEKAASNQMGVTLITNGKLLEDVDQGKLVNNINLIRISVNGGKNSHQKVHNTITDEYLGIVKSINDIANLRSKENKEDDLYIGVTYLVNPANIKDIYATTQDLIQSGINGLFFRVLNEHKGFSKKDKSKLIEQIELTNNLESGVFIHFAERLTEPTANPNINKTKCYSGLMRLYIE